MNSEQRALRFSCADSALIGVIDVPDRPLARGMVIVNPSEQYRAGAHRQHTLLSRTLAARGIPVLRFDRRGCGDSEAGPRPYDSCGPDLGAAIKELFTQVPALREAVLWGLGDGAVAAALYAAVDARVRGMVLLSPDVDRIGPVTVPAAPPTRLGEFGFWRELAAHSGRMEEAGAALRQMQLAGATDRRVSLAERIASGLDAFDGQLLLILAGQDERAAHARALFARPGLACRHLLIPAADRNFAARAWREQVTEATANWIVSW